jgi:hypothetical protein
MEAWNLSSALEVNKNDDMAVRRSTRGSKPSQFWSPSVPTSKRDKEEAEGEEKEANPPPSKKSRRSRHCEEHPLPLLGFKRVDDRTGTVIPLTPGNLLGRNPKKPIPEHVDLGITKENGGEEIARKLCRVVRVTSSSIRLELLASATNSNKLLEYKQRGDQEFRKINSTVVVDLQEGDVLSIRQDHRFEVMPTTTRSQSAAAKAAKEDVRRTTRKASSCTPTAASSPKASVSTDKTKALRTSTRTRTTALSKASVSTDTTKALTPSTASSNSSISSGKPKVLLKKPPSKQRPSRNIAPSSSSSNENKKNNESSWETRERNGRIVLLDGMEPFRPTRTWGVDSPNCQPFHLSTSKEESKTTTTKPAAAAKKPKKDDPLCDSDDDDEEDDGRPHDMHVSLANAYWKALNSNMPHIGAGLLQTLLASNKLPPAQLCGDLVTLLTFGPQSSGHAFYDGNRLQLAMKYIQDLVDKHPTKMYERLALAAGSSYWKTVLDQLRTLPYEDKQSSESSVDESLQLHCFSLRLFELLLQGSLTTDSSSAALPLVCDLQDYDGTAACKVAAQAMASVWVQHGHHLWEEEGSSTTLAPAVQQLTDRLGRIMSLLLHKFVDDDNDMMNILWNAMDSQIHASEQEQNKQKKNAIWRQQLKLYWICSLEMDDEDWQPRLAKQVGVQKKYKQLMGGPL